MLPLDSEYSLLLSPGHTEVIIGSKLLDLYTEPRSTTSSTLARMMALQPLQL